MGCRSAKRHLPVTTPEEWDELWCFQLYIFYVTLPCTYHTIHISLLTCVWCPYLGLYSCPIGQVADFGSLCKIWLQEICWFPRNSGFLGGSQHSAWPFEDAIASWLVLVRCIYHCNCPYRRPLRHLTPWTLTMEISLIVLSHFTSHLE